MPATTDHKPTLLRALIRHLDDEFSVLSDVEAMGLAGAFCVHVYRSRGTTPRRMIEVLLDLWDYSDEIDEAKGAPS